MKYFLLVLLIFPIANLCAEDRVSLSFEAAKKLWEKNNLDLKLSADQMKGARADGTAAAQRPIPVLSLNTTSIETGEPAFIKQADSVARIDEVIERGDKRALRIREARLRSDAAQADLDDTRRAGEIELGNRYYDLLLAQRTVSITEENAELFEQSMHAAQQRVNAGDLAAADFSRLQVDALRAQGDADAARNAVRQAQVALGNYLAIDDIETLNASDTWPALHTAPVLEHIDAIVAQRPDVIAAEKRAEAAAAAFEQAQAKRTRDITVGVQVEHNGQNRPLNTVGVGLSIPLSTSTAYSGEIARAGADLEYAQHLSEQARNRAKTEIVNARNDLVSAYTQLERYDRQLLDAAMRARDAAELGYRHGATPLMDVLDARRIYRATQIDAVTARANYAKALVVWNSLHIEAAP